MANKTRTRALRNKRNKKRRRKYRLVGLKNKKTPSQILWIRVKMYFKPLMSIVGSVLAFVVLCNTIILTYDDSNAQSVLDIDAYETVLVFGGGMKENGQMTDMQKDRVMKAVELFYADKIHMMVMTGDDGRNNVDEVTAMKELALNQGIPEGAIVVDPHGYNTYTSCKRASEVYGLSRVVGVSQNFHLHRIEFLCEKMGVDVIPVSADLREYPGRSAFYTKHVREVLARVKAILNLTVGGGEIVIE